MKCDDQKSIPFESLNEKYNNYFFKKYSYDTQNRDYIGASIIGHPCDRRVWISGSGKEKEYAKDIPINFNKIRAFERGKKEEISLIKILSSCGYEIIESQKSISAYKDRFKGHVDGIIKDENGVQYVLEIKTMKEKYFNQLTRKDNLKEYSEQYYAQIQCYMHFLDIPQALFIALNKNDDSIYTKIIKIDKNYVEGLRSRIERIIDYTVLPSRLYFNSKPPIVCKTCDLFEFCEKKDKIILDYQD